ncbi:MAG: glycosyltransferase family 39 protein [Planctomycetota bacterium]
MPFPANRSSPGTRTALLLMAFGYAALLVIIGILIHPIAAIGVENDSYSSMAQQILHGHLPHDEYRPLAYHLLTAAFGWVTGDVFLGGKIVSCLAAGGLLVACHALAESLFDRSTARLTVLLVACNGWVMSYGMMVSTDMLFTALSVGALTAATQVSRRPGLGPAAFLGVMLGLSYWTRYTAILLLLPAALALWCASATRRDWSTRLRRCGVCAATTVLALVPHFVLSWVQFGSLLHDQTWRSTELKYSGGMDFDQIADMEAGSLTAVLLRDPTAVAARAAKDFGAFLSEGFGTIVLGRATTQWGLVVLLIGIAAIWQAWRRRRSPVWVALAYIAVLPPALCVAFVPEARMLLAIIPVVYAAAVCATVARQSRMLAVLRRLVLVAAVGMLVANATVTLIDMEGRQPTHEVEVVRRLQRETPHPFLVLSTYGHLAVLMPQNSGFLRPPSPGADCVAYLQSSVDEAQRVGATYVLFGRVSTGAGAFAVLSRLEHPNLRVVRRTPDVLLFERVNARLEWIEDFAAGRTAAPVDTVTLRVRLRPDIARDQVFGVAARLGGAAGAEQTISLLAEGDGVYAAVAPITIRPAADGSLQARAVVMSVDGRFGATAALTVH